MSRNKGREGFTTGSCAAAAAKAAAYILLSGKSIDHIDIVVPRGDIYHAEIRDIMLTQKGVKCAVRKDSGDDPDVTDGCLIYAYVELIERDKGRRQSIFSEKRNVIIDAGEGIGKVTRPGLDQPVGEAAINSVPRQMIIKEVSEVCELFDNYEDIKVTLSVPGGEELAKRTFNQRLGIEGGISIIGTTGVVEPMSSKALKDTIFLELKQRKEQGDNSVVITPGNYGRDFLKRQYGYDIDRAVKCSNYIGDTLDMCMDLGFEAVLIAGHIGKLIKLAGGIMNTHSHESDARLEILAAAGIRAGLKQERLINILDSVSTTEALGYLDVNERKIVMSTIMDRVDYYLDFKIQGCMGHECIIYCDEFALLGSSTGALKMLGEMS
ncbi:MAG: cobalt-precorrin-5B (C(1))-methyltransferase CbiD [Lachnospiraceae bacterium]|nr:cobalt-precorrin-5B (C(1))-methyltransferase CbiD [Lachnospiraceae bacterium]